MDTQRSSEENSIQQNIDRNQLIEERKQKKWKMLKQKLEQKLKIIRDRRVSGVNNEPFPDGAFDRLQNNNVWEDVFSFLKETSDVLNALYLCRTFAEILEERRMLMGMQNVLNVFKIKVDKAYEVEGEQIGDKCCQNWNKTCLSARSVCKAWKKTVDLHCGISRDEWFLTQATGSSERGHDLRTNMFTFKVDNEESFDDVASLFKEGFTVSPIRDMSVLVEDNSPESYYRKLMANGCSVGILDFRCAIGRRNPADACKRLCDLLKQMENLKGMHLSLSDRHDINGDELLELGPRPRRSWWEVSRDIEALLNQRPLPLLGSVVHFSCYHKKTGQFLVSHILRRCNNLKSLNLNFVDGCQGVVIEALKGLTLERFVGFANIITSYGANWPLKYLEIKEWIRMHLDSSATFPAINRFRNTLEHLYIGGAASTGNTRLELLRLKSFCIGRIERGTLGFDGILSLKSLENITVSAVDHEDENALVKVKRYYDSGEMHKSNVWQCFPNLMWLRLGRRDQFFRRPSSP